MSERRVVRLGLVSRHHAFLHATFLLRLGDGERGQLPDAVQPFLTISYFPFAAHHQRALEESMDIVKVLDIVY